MNTTRVRIDMKLTLSKMKMLVTWFDGTKTCLDTELSSAAILATI